MGIGFQSYDLQITANTCSYVRSQQICWTSNILVLIILHRKYGPEHFGLFCSPGFVSRTLSPIYIYTHTLILWHGNEFNTKWRHNGSWVQSFGSIFNSGFYFPNASIRMWNLSEMTRRVTSFALLKYRRKYLRRLKFLEMERFVPFRHKICPLREMCLRAKPNTLK